MKQLYPELPKKAIVYAYQFSREEGKTYILKNGVTATFTPGQILYVGLDTTDQLDRFNEHLKPSKISDTSNGFHEWLQNNKEDWIWIRIAEINGIDKEDVKGSAHEVETFLTKQYQPFFAMRKNNF